MRMFHVFVLLAFLSAVCFIAPARAELGVVIMHGKGSQNGDGAPTKVLAQFLENKGFIVAAPDMPWQAERLFDKTLDESMAEIDAIVAELKERGADRVVIAGHSLGANAALAYGARRGGLAGIVAIAPGHIPEIWGKRFADDVATAHAMIDAGKGAEKGNFRDFNQGKETTLSMPARNYLSWYDPAGEEVMPENAAALKDGVPLLVIVGEDDPLSKRGQAYIFDKAPANSKSRYIVIDGGHMATPKKGKIEILNWLNGL